MTHDASVEPTIDPVVAVTQADTDAGVVDSTVADDSADAPNQLPLGVAEPRTRWAGIVWGFVLAGMAGFGIWFLLSGFGIDGLIPWAMTLTPFTVGIYIVLVIAAIAVISALVVLIRHAQKTFAARRARS
ncbi:hypothetical protein [Microbacterium sp. NC79]|uniref:hypothetical protein n=1 Tax=Microbacterium sp. NC79 TaxID=2851009 RepID=UPI001C2B7BE7|nr:hypothetical protein [Microbacterium sp. NC79]MBV0894175.1 hypothetical protein [Microbacterium sp. NC79]